MSLSPIQNSEFNIITAIRALSAVNQRLLATFDLDTVVQQVVDEVHTQLLHIDDRYRIIVLSLVSEDQQTLRRTSLTITEEAKATMQTSDVQFKNIEIPMTATDNLGVKTILENRELYTTSFVDILCPPLSPENALQVQRAGGIEASYVFPVIVDNKPLGSMIFSMKKTIQEVTNFELELIRGFVVSVGLSISNAKLFEQIKVYQQKLEDSAKNLKLQNKDLELALTKLQIIRQQERDMLDVLGHELRTPITIVRNALAVLKSDFDPDQQIAPERLGSYINKALESTRREMALIETLLSATKIEANRMQINFEKVNLIDVVEDSIDAQRENAETRNLSVIFNKPAEPVFIYADRVRVQEIQDNFVSNAVKYTMKGTVEVSLSRVKDEQTGASMIKISTKDSGIGIPKEDIQKLGRKFFRARQYIKEADEGAVVRPGGTGLGLYVSFELIKIMGGSFQIESEIGKGSVFSYTIPEYVGQEPKHTDQTFEQEDDIEKRLKQRLEDERKRLIEEEKENSQLLQRHDNEATEPGSAKEAEAGDYKRISTANDIIQKINSTRKLFENNQNQKQGTIPESGVEEQIIEAINPITQPAAMPAQPPFMPPTKVSVIPEPPSQSAPAAATVPDISATTTQVVELPIQTEPPVVSQPPVPASVLPTEASQAPVAPTSPINSPESPKI